MTTTLARRITTAIAGTAVTAGIFASLTFAAPAEARAASSTNCSAPAPVSQPSTAGLNPLTRVAQVQAANPSPAVRNLDVSCVSN